jgi:hypothetical protein
MGRYTRHNRVLIGSNSQNLGLHNLLTSSRTKSDLPQLVRLVEVIQSDGRWNLNASWLMPSDTSIGLTGYTIQVQETIGPTAGTWRDQQAVNPALFNYLTYPEGVYKVRVRAEYPGGPSQWVESNIVNAFINFWFDWSANPQFHSVQG